MATGGRVDGGGEGGRGGEPERRAYALRLSPLTDGVLRDRVTRWVIAHVPGVAEAQVRQALADAGFTARVTLTDAEAAGALRELYATGLPAAAIALVPEAARRAPDADLERRLDVFRARGGRFTPTWNWHAFLFGPFWYLKRGLYAKGLVLLALGLVPIVNLAATIAASLATLVYCGVAADWDEYLWRVKRTQWW